MKKLISKKMILLYLLIIISTVLIFQFNNKDNITYLSLGDAYSEGKNSYGICEYGYSDYLKDMLEQKGKLKSYINYFSKEEITISELKNAIANGGINESSKQKKSLKGYLQEADMLTLSIGMSDLKLNFVLNDKIDLDTSNNRMQLIKDNFAELIKIIYRYYKGDIYVVGYPNNTLEDYYLSKAIREYNKYLSSNTNVIYIPVDKLEKNKDKYFLNPNNNYYNREGYLLIAKEIFL